MDVCVEHQHFLNGAEMDETYKQVNTFERQQKAAQAFQQWLQTRSSADLAKIVKIQPKQGLMIATPSHDGLCRIEYALGLVDLTCFMAQQNIYFEMARVLGSSLIPHARNSLVDMFLNSKCQRLLFVDADQGWDKVAALRLFQSNRRIVAGITPHKRFPINLNFEPLDEDRKYFQSITNKSWPELYRFAQARGDQAGEIQVKKAGTGFMMIDRSVFELMASIVDEYSAFDDRPEAKHKEFFKMGAHGGIFRGEDWLFCEYAKQLNIPIYINTNSLVSHSGQFTFHVEPPPPANLQALPGAA